MIGGNLSAEEAPVRLLPSQPGELTRDELERLWEVFLHIGLVWGEGTNTLHQRSQWLEFVDVRCNETPSYLEEYRSGLRVLNELMQTPDKDVWETLFFDHGVPDKPPTTRLAHFRAFVVEEFIRVWLASGGFAVFRLAIATGTSVGHGSPLTLHIVSRCPWSQPLRARKIRHRWPIPNTHSRRSEL